MSDSTGFSKPLIKSTGAAVSVCLFCSLATTQPAAAQLVAKETTQPVQMTRSGVRYTTGMTETSGWERQLVRRDSSLRHWNWSPIVSYNQSIRATSGQVFAAAPPAIPLTSHYRKPVHIPMPSSEFQIADLNRNSGGTGFSRHECVSGSLRPVPRSNRDVSGNLVNPPILSYGSDYGRSTTATTDGSLARQDVRGVIRLGEAPIHATRF